MKKFCENCGEELKKDAKFCAKCGTKVTDKTEPIEGEIVNENTSSNTQNNNSNNTPKSKIAAGILGILVGAFGVHNFYIGYTGKAVAQLLITVLSCGVLSVVSGIWGLVEGILILTGSINVDAEGNPLGE